MRTTHNDSVQPSERVVTQRMDNRAQGNVYQNNIPTDEAQIEQVIDAWRKYRHIQRVHEKLRWFVIAIGFATTIIISFFLDGRIYRPAPGEWYGLIPWAISYFLCFTNNGVSHRQYIEVINDLLALDSPKAVPSLLEVVAATSRWGERVARIHERAQQRLTELLPQYRLADLPELGDEHQKIVRKELRAFAHRIRYRCRLLVNWETDYLLGLLSALRPPQTNAERQEIDTILQRLRDFPPIGATAEVEIAEAIHETRLRLLTPEKSDMRP